MLRSPMIVIEPAIELELSLLRAKSLRNLEWANENFEGTRRGKI